MGERERGEEGEGGRGNYERSNTPFSYALLSNCHICSPTTKCLLKEWQVRGCEFRQWKCKWSLWISPLTSETAVYLNEQLDHIWTTYMYSQILSGHHIDHIVWQHSVGQRLIQQVMAWGEMYIHVHVHTCSYYSNRNVNIVYILDV